MAFNPAEFLQLAVDLCAQRPDEGAYRTAIGRAYYACHLTGREAAAAKGWFRPRYDGTDHSGLIRAISTHQTKWSGQLRTLLRLREHADYHLQPIQSSVHGDNCEYCTGRSSDGSLVNVALWTTAREIAQRILPQLSAIAPPKR